MRANDVHLSDEDLARLADGELSIWKTRGARKHLATCWDCRTRMADVEDTINDFVRLCHEDLESDLPPISNARARLIRELATSANDPNRALPLSGWRIWATVAVAVSLLAVGGVLTLKWKGLANDASRFAGVLPNRRLTPGVTRPVRIADICTMQHDEVVRPVSEDLQRKVFQEYRLSNASAGSYEIDYLITPGLGGSDSVGNLWPEPKYGAAWNSFAKDALEDRLHQMVCSGQVSLDEAQKEVSADWIAAYKKYFHANQPL